MGHKVHPTGFRIGIIRDWQSKWYSSRKQYVDYLHEDLKLRKAVITKYPDAGVSLVEIDRQNIRDHTYLSSRYSDRKGRATGRRDAAIAGRNVG
jgi:ribosomal protein S3